MTCSTKVRSVTVIKNVTLEKAKGMWETCSFKELAMKALRKRRADAVVAVKKEVISE